MDTTKIMRAYETAHTGPFPRGCTLIGAVMAAILVGGCSTQSPPAQLQGVPAANRLAVEQPHGSETGAAPEARVATRAAAAEVPEPADKLVHFHFDSSLVDPGERDILKRQIEYLAHHPQLSVILEGYADERGPDDYNFKLGLQRAQSVSLVLEQNGIQKNRIRLVSYGEAKPLAAGHTATAWQANRRVELRYLPSSEMVSALPGAAVR